MKRYVCYGGDVGQRYYCAATIAALYGVDIAECVLVDEGTMPMVDISELVRLEPQPSGLYNLEEVLKAVHRG